MQKTWVFVLGILVILAIAITAILSRPSPNVDIDAENNVVQRPSTDQVVPPQPAVSASGNVKVTSPLANEVVSLPLTIRGEARVFENVVNWRLKDAKGNILVEGFGTADAPDVGQFGTFAITTSYPKPSTSNGVLEVFTYSAKDGSETDMVAIPVRFSDVSAMDVKVYFVDNAAVTEGNCAAVTAFTRRIPSTTGVARAALDELLRGIYANEAKNVYSTSINTGVTVTSLLIAGDTATAMFSSQLDDGVAGSCRVASIRAQIEATLKQFPNIKNVVIKIEGVPDAEVLQP